MKITTLKHLTFLTITIYLFLGCVKQDKISSMKAIETNIGNDIPISTSVYGQYTDEIEEFLSATPMGSEIYLEEKEHGEWYIKIEKTFTVKNNEEKREMVEPIYGESILI